jgi:membrane associated rhomboid family serine protease
MIRITPVVKNLIILNVVVFILGFLVRGLSDLLALHNVVGSGEFLPFQLFTYMFVHASFGHIFFNMLGLFFFGPILESTWGSMRFLTFYLICGVGAGAFNLLVDLFMGAGSFGTMVGASGAIYGIMVAFGVLFPNMEVMLLFPPIPIKAKYLVLGFGAIALYSALNPTPGDNTAHFTHLGGIVVALILLPFWKSERY